MRDNMNSYHFEIWNRRENKFCSHEVSFRLHFKMTEYYDGMRRDFILGSVYMIFYHPKWNFISVKLTNMKSIPEMISKCTCTLNAISNESPLIHFASGKFCSHENLMAVLNFISFKVSDMKFIPVWAPFCLNLCEHK